MTSGRELLLEVSLALTPVVLLLGVVTVVLWRRLRIQAAGGTITTPQSWEPTLSGVARALGAVSEWVRSSPERPTAWCGSQGEGRSLTRSGWSIMSRVEKSCLVALGLLIVIPVVTYRTSS